MWPFELPLGLVRGPNARLALATSARQEDGGPKCVGATIFVYGGQSGWVLPHSMEPAHRRASTGIAEDFEFVVPGGAKRDIKKALEFVRIPRGLLDR